jgi:ribosomal protein S18 acetylase RimI-like enzyme
MLEIREASDLSPAEREAFVAIFENSFPPDERDDPDQLLATIARGERRCYLAAADRAVLGLAVVLPLPSESMNLLEYLAVDQARRNAGIGSALLEDLRRRLLANPSRTDGIVFEVESPDGAHGEEQALRLRRVGFYERHGAHIVSCAPRYVAPSLSGGEPVPFRLMWLPGPGSPERLTGERLRRCVVAILTKSYDLPATDPLVERVTRELAC